MSVEMLQKMSVCLYGAAGSLFVVLCILFFSFNMPKIFGDLSGQNARKEIRAIVQRERVLANNSQKIFAQKECSEVHRELEKPVVETGMLQREDFCLEQEMGYLGSSEWIA